MTIKAIIFDIGGVLAQDIWEHLFFEPNGIVALHKLNKQIVNEIGAKLWNEFAYRNDDEWQKLELKYWQRFVEESRLQLPVDYFVQLTDKFVMPITGMAKLVGDLKTRKLDLAICSNNTEFWFERQRKKLALDNYFETGKTILSSRIGTSKNSADFKMFKAVISALGAEKQECVFIDDSEENISRALEYGIKGILFPSHSEFGADYLYKLFEKMRIW